MQTRDFTGYVDHYLLNDLVTDDYASVRFYTEFGDFPSDPLPAGSVAEYREYIRRTIETIRARNARIDGYAVANLDGRTCASAYGWARLPRPRSSAISRSWRA